MSATLKEKLTQGEYELYQKILNNYMCQQHDDNPDMPIKDLFDKAFKVFLSQKWICHANPTQLPIPEDEYQKMAATDGPDLTRIPRSRYQLIKAGKNSKGQKKSGMNAYACYVQEQMKLLTGVEPNEKMKILGQKWQNMKPEEKESYKLKAQELQES